MLFNFNFYSFTFGSVGVPLGREGTQAPKGGDESGPEGVKKVCCQAMGRVAMRCLKLRLLVLMRQVQKGVVRADGQW